jgi:hypothetical protein
LWSSIIKFARNQRQALFGFGLSELGMYLLGRSTGLRASAALLGGSCFGFSGFAMAHLQHAPLFAVGSWLPWLVLFQKKYWQARAQQQNSVPWFLLSSLAIGLQSLGGSPQIALLNIAVFVLFGFFAPVVWFRSGDSTETGQSVFSIRTFGEAICITLLTVVLGAGLAAVQLVPTLELIGFSVRSQEMGWFFFTSYSLEPGALTQFVSPFAYLGAPEAGNMEYWAYVGILPLLLALIAPLLRRNARTWMFVLLGLCSLILALGGSTPIYQWLYYLPMFDRFRVPARSLFPFTFAAAYLAAIGFQELQARLHNTTRSHRVALVAGALLALGIFGSIGWGARFPSDMWMSVWQWLPGIFVLLGLGLILCAMLQQIAQNIFRVIAVGLTILDLALFAIPFSDLNQTVLPSEAVGVPRTVQAMQQDQSLYRVYSIKPPSTMAAARAALTPDYALQYAKQDVSIYAPLEFQRVYEYINHMTPSMLNLMDARYVLLPLGAFPGESPPFDTTEPDGGLTLSLLGKQPSIVPTQVAKIELTSYTQ